MRRECPGCAVEVEPREGHCPICDYEFPRRNPIVVGIVLLLVAGLLAPIIVGVIRMLGR